MKNDWKERLNVVYSTNPDYKYESSEDTHETETLPPNKQHLRIELDKRKGKTATLITGFAGTETELKALAKQLKTSCGVGGSTRDGEILIQGDLRKKIGDMLSNNGYKVRII